MATFDEKLKALLKTEQSFLDKDGELLEGKLQDSARNANEKLIKLLITDEEMRNKFFSEIAGYQVFNGNLFIEYISNKNFLDNSYTKYKNKIGLQINGKFLKENGDVALVRPFKDCVLEGGQSKEDEKKKEIFFNEILAQDEIDKLFAPKVLTNFKKFDKDGEHKVEGFRRDGNGTIKDNLIIKGNNLLALHTLKKEFEGQVKCIYIDPPYNTGTDSFGYNDNFNHSTWLTFMKNRLEISKILLKQSGSLFISIDENMKSYLDLLCREIGFEYFKELIRESGKPFGFKATKTIRPRVHETIFHYCKDRTSIDYKPTYTLETSSEGKPILTSSIIKAKENGIFSMDRIQGAKESVGFGTGQKPESLIKKLLESSTDENDIVLDFFSGSGTSSVVSLKMKRQFIVVEQLDRHIDINIKRLINVIDGNDEKGISKSQNRQGGGEFIYCELKKYNQEFIEQIEDAKNTDELLNIRENMKEKAYFKYNFDMQKFEESIDEFKNEDLEKQKELLVEILNKNQLYVNLSNIDDENFEVSDEDKNLNDLFYE